METSLLERFRSELDRKCSELGITCETWAGIRPVKRNLILVKSYTPFVLYVKERRSDRGFWGVTANRVRKLRKSDVRWYLILVASIVSSAHVLSDRQVIDRIETGEWTLGHDGDYKINQGSHLPPEARLDAYEQIFGVLL